MLAAACVHAGLLPDQRSAESVLVAVFAILADALASRRRVALRGFGRFDVSIAAPTRYRDLITREIVHIPSRRVVRFRAYGALAERLASPPTVADRLEALLRHGNLAPDVQATTVDLLEVARSAAPDELERMAAAFAAHLDTHAPRG